MKAAPVMKALSLTHATEQYLVHTGQHYDDNMSQIFFQQLALPKPNVDLGVGSRGQVQQTAEVMLRLQPVVREWHPDVVLVYGDVNSTLAGALVAAKSAIRVGHVEAGLRSFDRQMPEELNRVLTDHVASMLFTHSMDANENLRREGIDSGAVHLVGNVMIDTLISLLPEAMKSQPTIHVGDEDYGLVTLHRPSNVDDVPVLRGLIGALEQIARLVRLIFPVHPRTRSLLEQHGITPGSSDLCLSEPLGYLEFIRLQRNASFVITDSGGVQEESTYLRVPCLTVRDNTERPITVTIGTNTIIGRDYSRLYREVEQILAGGGKKGQVPPLWDGSAGERIAKIIVSSG